MTALLLNPFFWLALLLLGWASWRILRWLASGGRLPLRRRRGSATAFTAAGLSAQTFYGSGAERLIEAERRQSTNREDDDEGDPPDAGSATDPVAPDEKAGMSCAPL